MLASTLRSVAARCQRSDLGFPLRKMLVQPQLVATVRAGTDAILRPVLDESQTLAFRGNPVKNSPCPRCRFVREQPKRLRGCGRELP